MLNYVGRLTYLACCLIAPCGLVLPNHLENGHHSVPGCRHMAILVSLIDTETKEQSGYKYEELASW